MPKMKTRRGAAKRFSFTARGKVRFNHAKRRHILTKKSIAWKRRARAKGKLSDQELHLVRRMLPYG